MVLGAVLYRMYCSEIVDPDRPSITDNVRFKNRQYDTLTLMQTTPPFPMAQSVYRCHNTIRHVDLEIHSL